MRSIYIQNRYDGLGAWLSESSVIRMPTLRANEIVIGYRPIPSVEFQFILGNIALEPE